jgi:hypothetical protein
MKDSILLIITTKTPIALGEMGAIKMNLVNQFHIYKNENGELGADIELGIDLENVYFLGVEVPCGYKEYKSFKENVLKLGIDVDKLIDEEITKIDSESIVNELKQKYYSVFNL